MSISTVKDATVNEKSTGSADSPLLLHHLGGRWGGLQVTRQPTIALSHASMTSRIRSATLFATSTGKTAR